MEEKPVDSAYHENLRVQSETPTLSVMLWRDKRADERLWLLAKTDFKTGVLMVRHAGNSIWRKGAMINRKKADLFGIELVTAGNMRFVQDGKEYIVEPGQLCIKRKGANHFYEPGPAGFLHKRFMRLDGPLIDTLIGELGLENLDVCTLAHPAGFSSLQKRAIKLIREQPEYFETLLSLLAFETFLFVKQDISGHNYPPPVAAAVEFMRRNVHRKITIEELSGVAGLSDSLFFRMFKTHVGGTPLVYFTNMKIKRAAELLRHTLIPIKELAFSLGYEEHAYFTNQFHKIMGMSPRAFRKKLE
jgi:AraC-like DNA-binding protein